ncbi:tetratricopeptide repeat protein [Panacagrimonas sp.]|uniref:tetratricopeptide repeat protein n=1 Tax=Panacagrimonas sp. TaxID=2480088 RepID=UPI003B52C673
MKTMMSLAWMLLTALLLGGCASSTGQRERNVPYPTTPPRAVIPPGEPSTVPAPSLPPVLPVPIEPVQPAPPRFPRTAGEISGQAVVALMRQAADARAQGQLDLAASQLERAQRIEPRNYFVWAALAGVYLDQQQYDQAVSVASKSNSLARGNVYVELENWKTISAARQAQGDSLGALRAQTRIDEIERQLGGG